MADFSIKSPTGRLAATYLAIIMAMTLLFSVVIYAISSNQFDRPLPTRPAIQQFRDTQNEYLEELFEERAQQARAELLLSLGLLNIAVLIGGGIFSYYLARRTLKPIEAAMQAQSQFVSDASHELRTPLTALQTTNEVAYRKKKLSLKEAKEVISVTIDESIKLRDLTSALLSVVKNEQGDKTTESINLQNVVGDVLQTLVPNAQAKNISVEDNVAPLTVTANESAIRQIIKVFLDNAIAYSPNKSTINVTTDQQPTQTVVSVQDDGPGIDAAHHTKIFDRFYRVDDARSTSSGGNGLGLAIAKTIADRHGYKLSVDSQPGSGSTFSLRIPT